MDNILQAPKRRLDPNVREPQKEEIPAIKPAIKQDADVKPLPLNTVADQKFSINGFMQSNNILSLLGFLVLIVIVFYFLLRVSVYLITRFFSPHSHVVLFNGMVPGNVLRVFPQDPSISGAVTIVRSDNAISGIEFSWSAWIYVNSINNSRYQCIFTKGNNNPTDGLNGPNNAPGMYLMPSHNELMVVMNTFEVINEEIHVPDIPLNHWVNVILVCKNKTLDVYINGVIAQSKTLIGVPKQNYGDVMVGLDNGFDGYLSNLSYWNHCLSLVEIQQVFSRGPNTKDVSTNNNLRATNNNYLSLQWYTDK